MATGTPSTGRSAKEFNAIALATTPSMGFYVGVIVLAVLAPKIAVFGYLLTPRSSKRRQPANTHARVDDLNCCCS